MSMFAVAGGGAAERGVAVGNISVTVYSTNPHREKFPRIATFFGRALE
jgi:hypothetical protein